MKGTNRCFALASRKAGLWALLSTVVLLVAPLGAKADEAKPETVARLAWGTAPDELGRHVPEEGAPEAPMSFALDPVGGIVLLDQVNGRVVFVGPHGKVERTLQVAEPTFQDIALGPAGELIALDRLGTPRIVVMAADGKLLGSHPLESAEIPEGGGTTRILYRPDGVWIDVEHRRSVRVLDAQLDPVATRESRGGAPGAEGRYWVQAKIVGPHSVEVWTVDAGRDVIEAHRTLDFAEPIGLLTGLVVDERGRVTLAVEFREENPETFEVERAYTRLVALDRDLTERAIIETPPLHGYLEQFKVIDVDEQGRIVQMVIGDDAVEVLRWTP